MLKEKAKVLFNKKAGHLYFRIGLTCHNGYAKAQPGQFIMLHLPTQDTSLLPRPFSIHRLIVVNSRVEGIEVLFKVVGGCTEKLSKYKEGDYLDILGPLGRGFIIPDKYQRIFIVSGGIGIAPLFFLASSLWEKMVDLSTCSLFTGGRSKHDILCIDDFSKLGITINIATDDGSLGEKSLVTDLLETSVKKNPPDIICACGPLAMIGSVARNAERYSVPCQVSIETIMACGIGACLGCAVKSKNDSDKYLHVCIDGPVFDATTLKLW
ncbi:MAG: dihydroorotate dehydrogenase electron transfer subunit [Thermodesulfobacteriota bacterium]|nr:dihydroorotate dehydrogenase electron transfer subunit [Thermodesulfobacteriota bacterium]